MGRSGVVEQHRRRISQKKRTGGAQWFHQPDSTEAERSGDGGTNPGSSLEPWLDRLSVFWVCGSTGEAQAGEI